MYMCSLYVGGGACQTGLIGVCSRDPIAYTLYQSTLGLVRNAESGNRSASRYHDQIYSPPVLQLIVKAEPEAESGGARNFVEKVTCARMELGGSDPTSPYCTDFFAGKKESENMKR